MGWATMYIDKLLNGEVVEFRPRGNSMRGIVNSGDLVVVEPVKKNINIGDVVLCRVRGREFLHKVKAINSKGQYLIGNNRGGTNGWISFNSIYGIMIENKGKQ